MVEAEVPKNMPLPVCFKVGVKNFGRCLLTRKIFYSVFAQYSSEFIQILLIY
jgi:hypothetical protein